MKKRVLVFPCGSEIGLEVYNSVKNSIHFELIGLSSIPDHGKFVYNNYIEGICFTTEKNFIRELAEIIFKYKIDIIYPTMDSVIEVIKENENSLGVKVIGSSYEVAKICASKYDTYNLLKNHVKVPILFKKADINLNYPLFAKPNRGYGSRNVRVIRHDTDLIDFDFENNLLCEYLPGLEYTVDCFTGLDGSLSFVGARERSRTQNGISVNTKTNGELTKEFLEIAAKINALIPFKGSWFFQMKRDINNQLCLLEVACRFAGSSSVHRIQGVNFAMANLYVTLDIDPVFLINEIDVELDRALGNNYKIDFEFDSIFIDFDDTIIVDGKVNLDAIELIYHAHNCCKKVYLITKHNGDIYSQLNKFRLTSLFDSIIHLQLGENKVDYIRKFKYDKSIFIDDSFMERKMVYEALSIKVFSVDAIKSLTV